MKQFENVRIKRPKSSVFDLSHERRFTMDMGNLVPCLVQETLPGDKFRIKPETLIRLQPLLAPIMHRVNVYCHFFFIPNRLVWDEWEKFITGTKDQVTGLEPNFPKITGNNTQFYENQAFNVGSLADYIGFPSDMIRNVDSPIQPISQLPFRAYQLIYNQYYRDQNLENEIVIPKGSVDLTPLSVVFNDLIAMRKRCWEKDYFTSALPTPQRGEPVTLPLGGEAPVSGEIRLFDRENPDVPLESSILITDQNAFMTADTGSGYIPAVTKDSLTVDLSEATSVNVNELRRAFSIQRWLEKSMRGGQRYIEQNLMHFGVKGSDYRLQRPQFIGGGKLPVKLSEVLQMSQTDVTPQGNMAGHGLSAGIFTSLKYRCEEHGQIIGIMSIIPRSAYQQGIPKHLQKFDKFDFFFPDFAHIGEQPVYRKEVYYSANSAVDNAVFGYQPRGTEYRVNYDSVHGDLRTSLDYWTMVRKFSASPLLNNSFVRCDPTKRIYPVIEEDHDNTKVIVDLYLDIQAIRPVPKFGDPI